MLSDMRAVELHCLFSNIPKPSGAAWANDPIPVSPACMRASGRLLLPIWSTAMQQLSSAAEQLIES